MEYSFAPLYVRIVFWLLLGIITATVLFLWMKKQNKKVRIMISVMCILIFLAISCSTFYSIVNPQIKTITCTYVDAKSSADQLDPFSMDYEFLYNGENLWIELDALTRNKVLRNFEEIEKGKTYVVTYEVRENIILGIQEE